MIFQIFLFTPSIKFIPLHIPALCNDDPNGNVPLGKSCNRYWQCQGGYPRLQRCPAMLVFDRRSLRCVVPPTEECDVPSTTTPQPEEPEIRQVRPSSAAALPSHAGFRQAFTDMCGLSQSSPLAL